MMKFILKYGATGSTARWVAKNYFCLKAPGETITETMIKILEIRYRYLNIGNAKQAMNERMSYLNNLTDFTFSILQTERAIKTENMDLGLQMLVVACIREELKRKGVPDEDIGIIQ